MSPRGSPQLSGPPNCQEQDFPACFLVHYPQTSTSTAPVTLPLQQLPGSWDAASARMCPAQVVTDPTREASATKMLLGQVDPGVGHWVCHGPLFCYDCKGQYRTKLVWKRHFFLSEALFTAACTWASFAQTGPQIAEWQSYDLLLRKVVCSLFTSLRDHQSLDSTPGWRLTKEKSFIWLTLSHPDAFMWKWLD